MARRCAGALSAALFVLGTQAHAADAGGPTAQAHARANDAEILGPSEDSLRLQSVMTRITSFDQYGHGYQSQAGPPFGPGSERTTILEPQVQIVASQGPSLTHVVTIPIDVITAASPDAIDNGRSSVDVVSSASRHNVAGTIDWATTYRSDPASYLSMTGGVHLEEPFRSWHGGLGGSHAFAGGDTVVAGSFLEVFDWFDQFDITGHRHGRAERSSTTASVGVTQIITPTTVIGINYGLTVQRGQLGNTWNSVPLTVLDPKTGLYRGAEILPDERMRHGLVLRASQFLPWNGALHLYYRFYADDWGLVAHSIEGQLMQRLSPMVYLGALYRYHAQNGVDFFTTLAGPRLTLRTADSDLAPLESNTIGGRIVFDVPMGAEIRFLHFELGYERYFRNNDLSMDIVTCATGYRF